MTTFADMIIETLKETNKPVVYQEYEGSEQDYIRFFFMPQMGFSANDVEVYTTHFVQVDYFTLYNPEPVASQIKNLMNQAGFKKNFEHETYEEDTELFHYILRFYITKEEK